MIDIDSEIEFRYLQEENIDQYIRILQNFFGKNYYAAKKKFIQWQYKNSVFHKEFDHYSILAAFHGTEILAIDAFLPWRFYIDGKDYGSNWDIEWLNNSKIKGLGRRLVKIVVDSAEIYCGYGYNTASKKAYKTLNFLFNDEIERKIALLNREKCLDLFSNENNRLFVNNNIAKFKKTGFVLHGSTETISENYWRMIIQNKWVVSYKGVDYLDWRFIQHPYIQYSIISGLDSSITGIGVVRIEKIRGHEEKVARIVDLLPVKGSESELLNSILSYCCELNVILVDFYCVSTKIANEICPFPFISLKQHRDYDIPMLFQPIELRKRKSINYVLNNDSGVPFDFEDVYATKADGDQDVNLNVDYETVSI